MKKVKIKIKMKKFLQHFSPHSDTEFHPGRLKSPDCDNNSQLTLLEKKLEIVKQMNKESSRLPIPLGNILDTIYCQIKSREL